MSRYGRRLEDDLAASRAVVDEATRPIAEHPGISMAVAAATGFTGEIRWDSSMPNGQPRRSLDASKAAALFGFKARTPLEEGIRRTVAWFREQRQSVAAA